MSHLQLAAIVFTDIVGYTALMGKDTNNALKLVQQSKLIQKPLIEKHRGKWIKEMGDGVLAQFNTALDAVKCAIEIQKSSKKNFGAELRIGIHLGDITFENNDVYGDGVNVASRLESAAEPGGIYISESVDKAIRGQIKIQTRYLGALKLKNVSYEIGTYALQGPGLPIPILNQKKGLSGKFFAGLLRRGILSSALTYIVLSSLFLLLFAIIKPFVSLPDLADVLIHVMLFTGFPIAMFFAWHYEKSPEGFIKINSEQSWRNPYSARQRKPLTSSMTIAGFIGIVIVLYFFHDQIDLDYNPKNTLSDKNIYDNNSIAVLPFVDLSPDQDQGFLCIGMTTEILNHLYKIEDLQVTSSTSVMRYINTDKAIKEIAKELGVANIVGGSVRKSKNDLKIDVHLLEGATDNRLWSETFDRELKDIFNIQSEVAKKIASTLRVEIYPDVQQRMEVSPTTNLEAYSLYLEARKDEDNDIKNQELLLEAIKLDPEFADAYITLGNYRLMDIIFTRNLLPVDQIKYLNEIKKLLNKGLELNPENAEGYIWLGSLNLWFDWDFETADKYYKRAHKLNPALPLSTYAEFLIATGRFQEAIERATHAVKANPYSSASWITQGLCYFFLGDQDMATESIKMAMIKNESNLFLGGGLFRILIYQEKYDEVLKHYEAQYANQFNPRLMSMVAIAYYHTGQYQQVNKILDKLIIQSKKSPIGSPSFYIAMIYAQRGEIDLAFQSLNKAYKDHEVEMYWLKVEPPLKPLHEDARWNKLLDKTGFTD